MTHECICTVAVVHLNTMGLNVIRRFQITVQISRQLYSRAQENVSVKNPFVLATKLAVTRISRLTTTVEVRDCLEAGSNQNLRFVSFGWSRPAIAWIMVHQWHRWILFMSCTMIRVIPEKCTFKRCFVSFDWHQFSAVLLQDQGPNNC